MDIYLASNQFENLYIVKENALLDERGEFARVYCRETFEQLAFKFTVGQINRNLSKHKGTFRGFHYQLGDDAEAKYVRVLRGSVLDIVVNVNPKSSNYLKSFQVELNDRGSFGLLIGPEYAHGVLTLSDNVEMEYLSSWKYVPASEQGFRWNDPLISLKLPFQPVVISKKDESWSDIIHRK